MDSLRDRMPEPLLRPFLGMELWQWLALVVLVLVSNFLWRVVPSFVGLLIRRAGFRDKLSQISLRELRWAGSVIVICLFWWISLPYLDLPDIPWRISNFLVTLASVMGGALLVSALFDASLDASAARATELVNRADHILIPIARKLGKFVIVIAGSLIFAACVGVNVAGVIAGLGITGLLFALAAKDSVENIFGSVTILFDMPFGIGDLIKTSSVEGTVEEINLRSTRLRTSTDSLITLPNSNLIRASVENFGCRRYRPVSFKVLVSYTNQRELVLDFVQRVREIVTKNEKIRADNAFVHLHEMNEGALGVLVEFSLITDERGEELELREAILLQILEAAHDAKVVLGPLAWMPIDAPDLQRTQNQAAKA